VEQRKVVDVTQVRRAQHFRAKMVQTVEINVGKKLAGQVADRQAAPTLRANNDETPAPRKFTLEGVGEESRGHAQ